MSPDNSPEMTESTTDSYPVTPSPDYSPETMESTTDSYPVTPSPDYSPEMTESTTESSSSTEYTTQFPETPLTSGSNPDQESTTAAVPTNADTSCREDGWYVHPEDCTRFYRCYSRISYQFDCPPGLFFDPILYVCNWPSDAGCHLLQAGAWIKTKYFVYHLDLICKVKTRPNH